MEIGARPGVARRPEPAAMRLDYGPTDGQSHSDRSSTLTSIGVATAKDRAEGTAKGIRYNVARRSSCAFTATTTVLNDMRIAPTAGLSTIPHGASTPAASGIAAML